MNSIHKQVSDSLKEALKKSDDYFFGIKEIIKTNRRIYIKMIWKEYIWLIGIYH